MKKVAYVFVLAVFIPSLLLAYLAIRSLRDQQFVIERQQSILYQGVADSVARDAQSLLADRQREFVQQVETLLRDQDANRVAKTFDDQIRHEWPYAEVGFVVTLNGELLSPQPNSRPEAQMFCAFNNLFLGNQQIAEVYANAKAEVQLAEARSNQDQGQASKMKSVAASENTAQNSAKTKSSYNSKTQQRVVTPQQPPNVQNAAPAKDKEEFQNVSKVAPSEAEFRQLIGEETEGMLARFVEDKLSLLVWHRPSRDRRLIFGAQLSVPAVQNDLKVLLEKLEPALRQEICVAILDDKARPAVISHPGFQAKWKHPFVATEIGPTLPHWEVSAYLLNPAKLQQAARKLIVSLGLIIGMLVLTIAIGGGLIFGDLKRQAILARQKTDFVSNVSHELKTPLTSIRMFSDLLAEGRVEDEAKRRSYFNIITAETARLTRLINNVLDFSHMERGERKYNFLKCDFTTLVRETVEIYRPHVESNSFKLDLVLPDAPVFVSGDRDALSQIVVNLLSNAEKYSGNAKEISVEIAAEANAGILKVLDRGPGVPPGCERKIFEQFYRAHDSLSCGIQGSGLGLTLARQIARAHGGDVTYEPRHGGGSCFCLRIPKLA
ncbi:MAG: HAMP domain-containing sensor histidine kinase [Verrucomicrobiota bacterium]